MTEQKNKTEAYIYPKEFFEKNKTNVTKGLCFIIMPFQDKTDRIYNEVISEAIRECGLTPIRADQIFDTRPIMISVMEKINESEIIIADVTDRNPNVFYELGMAHITKDRVILLSQDIEDVPFDLRHFRFIIYEDSEEGGLKLHENIKETLSSIGAVSTTPVVVATSEETEQESDSQVKMPEITSVIVTYEEPEDWYKKKGELFATLVDYVDFEKIEDKSISLTFPQGQVRRTGHGVELMLRSGDLRIGDLVAAFGDRYYSVRYNLDSQFNIADIVTRSKKGNRVIESIQKDVIIFVLKYANLSLLNTGTGSTVNIYSEANTPLFSSKKAVVEFRTILNYLMVEPPGHELEDAISASI